jgi:hypothetical protein
MPAIVHYQRSAVDLDQMFRSSGAHQTRPSASGAIRDFHHGLLEQAHHCCDEQPNPHFLAIPSDPGNLQ